MSLLNAVIRAPISEALGWTLIHSLWEGAMVAAVLAASLFAVRSPRIRYTAACVALLALLASFAITLLRFLPERAQGAGIQMKMTSTAWTVRPDVQGSNSHFPGLAALIPWLGPVWTLGVCVCYLRCAAGWLWLSRMRHRGVCSAPDCWHRTVTRLSMEIKVSRPVKLLESLLADSPVVLGHFRPVLLVPLGFLTGLPPDKVETILLHELTHIRRSDYLINVGQRFIEGLLFYHPAVWWVSQVIRIERENCCDDMVVDLRGDARGYAVALTALEQNRVERRWATAEPGVPATGGNLMKRIERLLCPKDPGGLRVSALAAVVLMASAGMLLAAWYVNPNSSAASQQMDKKVNDHWQKWVCEEVVYLISKEEKTAFEQLKTDAERQRFVEQFWERRNPTPGAPENKFKEEYYRRIAYANGHWAWKLPGWRTDRGRLYILYGPPDEIDSHPSSGPHMRPESEGGGTVITCAFEDWRYARFQDIGSLTVEFIDPSGSGEYRMTLDPKEKYKKP